MLCAYNIIIACYIKFYRVVLKKNILKDSRRKDENAHFRTRRLQQHSVLIYRGTT